MLQLRHRIRAYMQSCSTFSTLNDFARAHVCTLCSGIADSALTLLARLEERAASAEASLGVLLPDADRQVRSFTVDVTPDAQFSKLLVEEVESQQSLRTAVKDAWGAGDRIKIIRAQPAPPHDRIVYDVSSGSAARTTLRAVVAAARAILVEGAPPPPVMTIGRQLMANVEAIAACAAELVQSVATDDDHTALERAREAAEAFNANISETG